MAITAQVLFDYPQHQIAPLLLDRLQRCKVARLVSGFCTVEGLATILPGLKAAPSKVECLIVGAGTYQAFEAFDSLLAAGVPADRLYVHLGHTRQTTANARHRFYRYHPMLHSKVFLFEMPDGGASAFIGSHNLTGFALRGQNGEAGVMLEGSLSEPQFAATLAHIKAAREQAVPYSPDMKEAYAWWLVQLLDGLKAKMNDRPAEGEAKKTIVILAVSTSGLLPKDGEVIYFEIPAALGRVQALEAEVHVYVFGSRPASPLEGLRSLDQARASLWCQTTGLEVEQGGQELLADWQVVDRSNPQLVRTPKPFRPSIRPGMQQIRVKVRNKVYKRFEYLFTPQRSTWLPVYSDEAKLTVPTDHKELLETLSLVQPEDKEWLLVKGLKPEEESRYTEKYAEALRETAPQSGSFVLVSLWRRGR